MATRQRRSAVTRGPRLDRLSTASVTGRVSPPEGDPGAGPWPSGDYHAEAWPDGDVPGKVHGVSVWGYAECARCNGLYAFGDGCEPEPCECPTNPAAAAAFAAVYAIGRAATGAPPYNPNREG